MWLNIWYLYDLWSDMFWFEWWFKMHGAWYSQLTQCDWFIIVQCKGMTNCAYFNYVYFSLEMASVPNLFMYRLV